LPSLERRHHSAYNPSSACSRNPDVTCQMNPKMKSVFTFFQAICSSAAGLLSPGVYFPLSCPALELSANQTLRGYLFRKETSSLANLSTRIQTKLIKSTSTGRDQNDIMSANKCINCVCFFT